MRVPTITQYQRQIDTLTSQLNTLDSINTRINSNKKLINSSDDPILSLSIKSTQNSIERIQSYEHNTVTAQNRASDVEASVKDSLNVIERLRELGSQASSDTFNDSDRTNIAKEARGLLGTLLGNANKQDSDGNYIFSGTRSDIQSFGNVNGSYVYLGSLEVMNIDISEYTTFRYSDSGQSVFGDMRIGNGIFTVEQGTPANLGTAETSAGSITSQSEYVEDNYRIDFVTNSAGKTAYTITGTNSGQIVPAAPGTIPDDAPDYIENQTFTFNGINMSIKGVPEVGDKFLINPSPKQNVMETVNQFISALETPFGSNPVDRAAFHQKIIQLNSSLSQAGDHLTHYLSEVGYQSAAVENQTKANKATLDNEQIVLGTLANADLYELIPLGKQYELSLQVTHSSYAQMQQFFNELIKTGF